ncbi:2-succinyl-5-enolpyruvyl-6-hydroxy-3-cyclohexene-1-carboxylic-acid synthase [Vibrio furnissii]|uniref:2-succinyl-5-enolpyruvyl-6-hydroxy-3- cyclohexene-1-carboxylic-acid synthase n=1 Tax=Vibrio furnissii TaxID=29494 RepID=UPI001EEA42A3|nr:2-succinyl-5-enolpyruvyl-6-hydroxy-3-cyclohexene-1-carboxylic-acid synthase [Vibrio furnissii]MCG6231788.1 2-succinyl-5-enolpyruvyl-6-hydroxy-3-cyclohexene-1-carboxylic-acid synthase [Vibrio furnissii]MCG6257342.1 2-succinyl-5-enolpyruvyl-6-hydroxy-3-cyclohexene-1-carboxylic-acid synthase [Vibrio furnissii]
MSQDQAVLNRIWCQTLLEEMTRFGVSEVCVAPGSRSTPLTLEAAANPNLTLHTHYDERGLGFMALGMAKASGKPVAVIVTSGTAVANVLPAIAESRLTGEKLIVLTADRPVELVGCGANQAINQLGIYSSHVTQAVNLPSPNVRLPLNWLLTTVDEALSHQAQHGGSVHFNCPFPEPLYSANDTRVYQEYLASVSHWQQSNQPYCERRFSDAHAFPEEGQMLSRKGLVIVGSVRLAEAKAAQQFAEKLGWPLLCDPQSGISSEWAHFDLWLQNSAAKAVLDECEQVVQFGSRIVSKRLNHWLEQHVRRSDAQYCYVSPAPDRNNQSHLPQQQWVCDIPDWIDTKLSKWTALNATHAGWADALKRYAYSTAELAKLHLSNEPMTEIALALDLTERAPHAALFVGNSLIVRLVDMFSAVDGRDVFSNRGASGIDGLVATAAGVQRAINQPMLMLMGDTSLLYDMNSLALVRNTPQPLVIVVANNDGGAIFDLLPVPPQQREALYQMPHGMQFKHVAAQFGLRYANPETLAAYQGLVDEHLAQGQGTLLIEITTPPQQAAQQIKQLMPQIHAL